MQIFPEEIRFLGFLCRNFFLLKFESKTCFDTNMPNSSPVYLEVEDIFAISAEQQSRRKSTSKEPLNYTNRALMSFVEAVEKMNEAVLVPSKLRDIEVRECDVSSLMPINSDLYSFFQMLNNARQDLFSSSNYQNTFMPAASANNSGQNSGRVTPTTSLSRRASAICMYGNSPSNGNGTNSIIAGATTNSTARTLMPPNFFYERKMSSNSLSGEISPDILNGTNSTIANSVLTPTSISPLSFVSRTASLNSLLAAVGGDDGTEPTSSEERVQQITTCFMHHLTALYTILGHFTRSANYITKRYKEETDDNS